MVGRRLVPRVRMCRLTGVPRGTSVCVTSAHSRVCDEGARAWALADVEGESERSRAMEVLYERCCGIDVHKKSVVACVLTPGVAGKPAKEVRTFGTMTADLVALLGWLEAAGCTHVAMESTGVYWKPLYNLLEGQVEVLVVNAQHIKAVPGRKTDVKLRHEVA